MAVGQRYRPLSRPANMGDHIHRMDRVPLDEVGQWRFDGGFGIDEDAAAVPFEKTYSPAILVRVGDSATLTETLEGETNIGGNITVHPEQLAHFA